MWRVIESQHWCVWVGGVKWACCSAAQGVAQTGDIMPSRVILDVLQKRWDGLCGYCVLGGALCHSVTLFIPGVEWLSGLPVL